MARIHVNTETGNTGTCRAAKGGCPFGGDSGEDNHYSTKEEAVAASEKMMSEKYKEVYKGYRQGETEGMGMHQQMKKRLIKEATEGSVHVTPATIGRLLSRDKDELIRKTVAEKLNSQKLLRDMADDESARVRKAVAMRSNNRAVLEKLTKDPDGAVRHAAMNNLKTPVKARKAAQDALRATNIENLNKARKKAPAAQPPANPVTTSPPASPPVRRGIPVATIKANNVSIELDEKTTEVLRSAKGNKMREQVAALHGVSSDEVNDESQHYTKQIAVIKGNEAHVYGTGMRAGKVATISASLHESLAEAQEEVGYLQGLADEEGKTFIGINKGSPEWLSLRSAHGGENVDMSINHVDTGYANANGVRASRRTVVVKATDGKTYTYNSRNLALLSVGKS